MSKLEISPEILEALSKLSSLLEEGDVPDKTLQTVVELSVATLPGCDSAGVTMRTGVHYRTAAATDEFALEIDRIQYELGDGPCLEALERGASVRVDLLTEETRWPEYTRRALDKNLRSSVSHALRDNGSIGALNLYSTSERGFDETSIEVSKIFARQATSALRNARTHLAARRLSDQLNEALRSRDLIGQAKGILMQREGIGDVEAFEMLKSASQDANLKLRDIARRIVDDHRGAD